MLSSLRPKKQEQKDALITDLLFLILRRVHSEYQKMSCFACEEAEFIRYTPNPNALAPWYHIPACEDVAFS